MTDEIYSYSRLKLFEGCPRAYYYKYIMKLPYPTGVPAVIGKIFHLAESKMINDGLSPEEALNYAIFEEGGLPVGEREGFMFSMLLKCFNYIQELNEYTDVLSETHLLIETEAGLLQGYLDVVADNPALDTTWILDFKVTWSPFSAEDTMQLPLYGYMYRKARGGVVGSSYKGKLLFPRMKGEAFENEIELTEEKIQEAYNWAIGLMKDIQSRPRKEESFELTTNRNQCNYCPYVGRCASGYIDGIPVDGQPKDIAQAQQIGEYVLLMEQTLKKIRDGLKQFYQEHGDIPSLGGKWTQEFSSPNPKMDITEFIQYCEDHELDYQEFLSLDAKKLKGCNELMEREDFVQRLDWTKPKPRFTFIN